MIPGFSIVMKSRTSSVIHNMVLPSTLDWVCEAKDSHTYRYGAAILYRTIQFTNSITLPPDITSYTHTLGHSHARPIVRLNLKKCEMHTIRTRAGSFLGGKWHVYTAHVALSLSTNPSITSYCSLNLIHEKCWSIINYSAYALALYFIYRWTVAASRYHTRWTIIVEYLLRYVWTSVCMFWIERMWIHACELQ